ncbi:hypothetical protein I203_104102 [Kwoniella mangroviensis CBS 8507]|uniref:uncharacterized protein n=1 Tax=Kwoniella mangroviensis CBS 8507 TaxID=1296122 RepID=UPI00080D4DA5|nr:uncharacterized protein I203_06408 [Kwoniella mangroviensis CBS 8507]OCF64673.1 hypothetical protein I203_06408 [Kwoniella mangroviensis CBS 8507]
MSTSETSTSPVQQNPPTTVRPPQVDIDAIQSSLSARSKRRLSLRTILSSYKSQNNLKGKAKADNDQAIAEDDEEVEEEEQVFQVDTSENETYEKSKGDPIQINKGQKENVNVEEECKVEFEKEYVWDVLFENQRGIYILGKGYFSSRSLLPADPSAFTRPSNHIPSASSLSMKMSMGKKRSNRQLDPGTSGSPSYTSQHSDGRQPGKLTRSNKTSYTLESYQPPLPDWQYLTPWMINMRTGTDELGWRYNAWFRPKGWSSHSGPLGWGGWVRRREWIRLRAVGVTETKLVDMQGREKIEKKGDKLKDVLNSEKVDGNVQGILVVMGKMGLDRQRLTLWRKWLEKEKKESECWKRLEVLCGDEQAVS